MREQYIKILEADTEQVHKQLMNIVVEDTKENVTKFHNQGAFMGKVGAKKFYVLYKPPYINLISFMTVLRGDINATEDGKTRVRYRFGKFKTAILLSSILLIAVTVLALYAFISEETNLAVNFCILGFWLFSVFLYLFSMMSSRAAQERLIQFLDELCN